jgi:predicted DNA-binding transcriptional regulator AlpA
MTCDTRPTTGMPEPTPWPATGFVVLKQILGRWGGPIPLSPSRWWQGVADGEFPVPIKLAGRTCWRVADIETLIASFGASDRSEDGACSPPRATDARRRGRPRRVRSGTSKAPFMGRRLQPGSWT